MERNVKLNITVFFWTTLEPAFVLIVVSGLVILIVVVLILVVLIEAVLVIVVLIVVVTGIAVLVVDVSATGNVKLKLLHKFVRQHRDSKTLLFIVWHKLEHPAWNFSTPKFHLNDWKQLFDLVISNKKKIPKLL